MSAHLPPHSSAAALLLAAGLLLVPAPGRSESSMAGQMRGSSASLDFRIVIPPVMQLLENSHPALLEPAASGARNAQQRLVVVSNMKHGFCVTMRLEAPQVHAWRLRAARPSDGVSLQAVIDGYRLCSARLGHYTLLLQHEFDETTDEAAKAMPWPVRTDITAL